MQTNPCARHARVEQEFPGKPEAARTAYLASLEQRHGVTLAVYQDMGRLVAGPDLHAPGAVLQAMKSDRNRHRRCSRSNNKNPRDIGSATVPP